MSRISQAIAFSCIAVLAAPVAAFAHVVPGDPHYHTFGDGFVHAATGLDHVFVAVLVGLWAAWRPLKSSALALSLYGAGIVIAGLLGLGGENALLDTALVGSGFAAVVAGMLKGRDWLVAALVLVAASIQGFIHGMAASSMGHSVPFIAGLTVATLAIAALAAAASRKFNLSVLSQPNK